VSDNNKYETIASAAYETVCCRFTLSAAQNRAKENCRDN